MAERSQEKAGQNVAQSKDDVPHSFVRLIFNPRAYQKRRATQKRSATQNRKPTGKAVFAFHQQNLEERMQHTQADASLRPRIRWADHGKENFDAALEQLKKLIDEFRTMLPTLRLDNPFRIIRPFKKAPMLRRNVQHAIDDFDSFHVALRAVNKAVPGKEPLKLTLKIEKNFAETKSRIEDSGFIQTLRLRHRPKLFSIMPKFTAPQATNLHDFILATTISQAGQQTEIDSLPGTLAELGVQDPEYNEIGVVTLDAQRIYHLQRILAPEDLTGGQCVADLVSDAKLRPKERISLSYSTAFAQLCFETINSGIVHRHLSKYQVFGQKTPAGDYGPEVLDSVWVDTRFGSSVESKSATLKPRKKFREERIDAATELGILIYQIAADRQLAYESTAEGLAKAQSMAEAALSQVERLCGLYMRYIVEVCFLERKGEVDERKIVEEVASALSYVVHKMGDEQ